MTQLMDTITDLESKALEQLTEIQTQVLEYLKNVVTAVEERLPEGVELPEQLSFIDEIPTLQEIVDTQFAFGKKLYAANEKFAKNVVKAVKPLSRESLVKVEKETTAAA